MPPRLRPFLLGAAVLLLPASALAQPTDDDREQARIHFESGRAHYSNGNYRQAVVEWETAYRHSELTEILYNLYQAHQRLGELDQAAEYLARYLEEGADIVERDNLEVRLANLRAEIEERNREAEAAAESDAERERARVQAEAERERAEREAAAAREETAALEHGAQARRTAALVSFIVGGVGLATFGVFAGLAAAEDGRLSSTCGADALRTCSSDDVATLDTYTLVADVALGVGLAGALVGGILFLTTLGGADDDEGRAAARVVPVVGPDLVGAQAAVRF